MNKKEIIVPVLVIGLALLFVGISIRVFLSNGKSKKWVARKMKIGGLLLGLTATSCNGGGEVVDCYQQVVSNTMYLNSCVNDELTISLDTNNIIKGTIYAADSSGFSFLITDQEQNKFQAGNLIPQNGKFEKDQEDFTIELDKNLQPGNYVLKLYEANLDKQDSSSFQKEIILIIK